MTVHAFAVSPDGNLLAYSYDNTGFRQFNLAVKDLRTGQTLTDHAERVGSVVWASDNQTIFYTQEDAVSKRQYRLYRHTVGSTNPDTLVYEEPDEQFNVDAYKTRSEALYLHGVAQPHHQRGSLHSGEAADGEWKIIEPRKQGVEYYPDHNGRLVLHPRQRYRTQLPPGERSRHRSRQQELA